jgi:polysaccharide export outer membrane protein
MKILLLALLALSGLSFSAEAQALLRPQDTIEIRLGGVPNEFISEFSTQYTIDQDGNLNLPYIGNVKVGGMQSSQAQKAIEDKLKSDQIYTHPTITITTQQTARFVVIAGAVRAPGRIQYTADMTLMSAINSAGGPNDFAGSKVELVRNGKRTTYDIRKLRKDPTLDPQVLPGDQINMAQSWF